MIGGFRFDLSIKHVWLTEILETFPQVFCFRSRVSTKTVVLPTAKLLEQSRYKWELRTYYIKHLIIRRNCAWNTTTRKEHREILRLKTLQTRKIYLHLKVSCLQEELLNRLRPTKLSTVYWYKYIMKTSASPSTSVWLSDWKIYTMFIYLQSVLRFFFWNEINDFYLFRSSLV